MAQCKTGGAKNILKTKQTAKWRKICWWHWFGFLRKGNQNK